MSVAYSALLKELRMARGKKKKKLRKAASHYRKRMIARNRFHLEDLLPKPRRSNKLRGSMSKDYRDILSKAEASKVGKKALRKYRSFIGIPYPTEISLIADGKKGSKRKGKLKFLVGMGYTPRVLIADGPKGKAKKVKQIKGRRQVACSPDGKKIYILKNKARGPVGKKLKFVGYVPETHYVLTRGQENAGSFKKGKYWVHEHSDEGGQWPKVYKDSSGNYVYGKGTYHVGKWIRR
jgi:hypothetical protein